MTLEEVTKKFIEDASEILCQGKEKSIFDPLHNMINADPDYAWGWHCNLAMPIMDELNCSHYEANQAAARIMQHMFQIDMTKHEEFPKAPPRIELVQKQMKRLEKFFNDYAAEHQSVESQKPGYQEGDTCNRNGCTGILDTHPVDGCYCHISPPCGACTSPRGFCPECGWEEADDPEPETVDVPAENQVHYTPPVKRELDPTKIEWFDFPHSSSSMIKEGVYPEGTTRGEVLEKVSGTFGGRFEHFGDGKFKYIAYTD